MPSRCTALMYKTRLSRWFRPVDAAPFHKNGSAFASPSRPLVRMGWITLTVVTGLENCIYIPSGRFPVASRGVSQLVLLGVVD